MTSPTLLTVPPDSTLIRLADAVRELCIVVASVAVIALVVSFGWLVFGRYVLNATPTWVEQLALLLICYIAFIGAAAGIQEDSHLGVTVFREMLPLGVQKAVIVGIDVLLSAFGAIMAVAGVTLMQFGWDSRLPMLDIPESFRTLAVTSCGVLVCLFAGSRALVRLTGWRQWQPEAAPLDDTVPAGFTAADLQNRSDRQGR